MTDADGRRVLDVAEAARVYGVSESTIRRAAHTTDPNAFPPPLRMKRNGRHRTAKMMFHVEWLDEWFYSWPEW